MRRLALILAIFAGSAGFASTVVADEETRTYVLEMYNAFGLVEDAEVKVAGVNAGTVEKLEISDDKTALITVEISGPLAVLGEDTVCSSEPQSLIAEYFIDCLPAGEPLEEGATLPKKVKQTVQNDLVLNTLRLPFKQRLALLINEFGTALAGNPENLNEAIRLGAPALEDLHDALKLLARQNKTIRQLNVDSDEIIGKLADRREDVVAFVREAGDTAEAAAERRDDLSQNFDLLDDFLAELQPTMVELENVAVETTPLLTDLRAAAPQLNELAVSLPAFNRATETSLVTLGEAAVPGRRALRRGERNGVFRALARAGKGGPRTGELLADFLRDIDDPKGGPTGLGRIVEVDDRAAKTCEDKTMSCYATGREGPTGFTGMEGILNYLYRQGGALNSYDEFGHLLHFNLYDVFTGPCGSYNSQQNWPTVGGGGRTTDPLQAERCVGLLGPNQPGISENLGTAPYHPSVCPTGIYPDSPEIREICDPPGSPRPTGAKASAESDEATREDGNSGSDESSDAGTSGGDGPLPDLDEATEDVRNATDGLAAGGDRKKGKKDGKQGSGGDAVEDLLDFLFTP